MKYYIIIFQTLLFCHNSYSQVNFVFNGNFETKSSCNFTLNDINVATFWYHPTLGTSDYFNSCVSPGSLAWVPLNALGYQYALSGNGYSGIVTYLTSPIYNSYREYIQSKLIKKLKPEGNYYFEFYINLADIPIVQSDLVAINSFGCYFSDSAFFDSISTNITRVPQFQTSSTVLYTDTAGWMKIQGVYKAKGGEEFITIGNFKDDASTQTQVIATSTVLPTLAQISYYYIDDVSIFEIIAPKAINDITICLGDSLIIGANDTAITCTWFPATGLNDSSLTNPTASPNQSTWYYVTHQNSFGYLAKDSILVTVLNCSEESKLEVPNIFSPNNDNQNDLFSVTSKNLTTFNCKIFNRYGLQVAELKEINESWDGRNKSGTALSEGVYYFYISALGKDEKKYELKGFVSLLR
jgi:gliding motility-associated-like protein